MWHLELLRATILFWAASKRDHAETTFGLEPSIHAHRLHTRFRVYTRAATPAQPPPLNFRQLQSTQTQTTQESLWQPIRHLR